jgi:hypothetical protein
MVQGIRATMAGALPVATLAVARQHQPHVRYQRLYALQADPTDAAGGMDHD